MRLSIKSLHYFLTAAELGSISKAADALNVVPAAVASAIEQVEAEFELKLVQRYADSLSYIVVKSLSCYLPAWVMSRHQPSRDQQGVNPTAQRDLNEHTKSCRRLLP